MNGICRHKLKRLIAHPESEEEQINKASRRLRHLAFFIFILSPLLAWSSIIVSNETAVFASLSRMIWYSGDALRILIAMLVLFLPMLVSFFLAHNLSGIGKTQRMICRICMLVSCAILYYGAMEVMPSDGKSLTSENIWHGLLSFGGIFMVFITYCLYTAFIYHKEQDGANLLASLLVFTLITGAFAVLNVFDQNSYVVASAASELYVLTMLSLIGYMTYYLAYRKAKTDSLVKNAYGTISSTMNG